MSAFQVFCSKMKWKSVIIRTGPVQTTFYTIVDYVLDVTNSSEDDLKGRFYFHLQVFPVLEKSPGSST